jgi:DnaK suppressor protein
MVPKSSPVPRAGLASANDEHRDRRQRLYELRRFRVEQLAGLERELDGDPTHDGVENSLHRAATTALAEIDAALERMAHGSYGLCLACAKPIPADRLDVLPMSALCMPCDFNEQNKLNASVSMSLR